MTKKPAKPVVHRKSGQKATVALPKLEVGDGKLKMTPAVFAKGGGRAGSGLNLCWTPLFDAPSVGS